MINKKHAAVLVRFSEGKDSFREVLEGVHFTEKFAEAADGFVLLRIPHPDLDDADFPYTEGAGDLLDGEQNFVIPSAALVQAAKTPSSRHLPTTENILITKKDDKLVLLTTDLGTPSTLSVVPIGGTFPDTDPLIPEKKPRGTNTATVTLKAENLVRVAAAAKALGTDQIRLQFKHKDYGSAVRIDFPSTDVEGAVAVVMPVSSDEDRVFVDEDNEGGKDVSPST